MSGCTPSCGHWAEMEELNRLRQLIVEWADADDAFGAVHADDAPERLAYVKAVKALRKAVGR